MSTFQNIFSAEFIRYNANAAGHATGDCVKRALSLAFDVPYNTMAKELIAKMKELRKDKWCIRKVYQPVIQIHGGSDAIDGPDPAIRLNEFADTIGSKGTWLVETGHKPKSSNHIVCVIDGTVYDSWDSTNEYVVRYYTVKPIERKPFTDINIRNYEEEVIQVAHDMSMKLVKKYPWYASMQSFKTEFVTYKGNNYKCRIDCTLRLQPREYFDEYTTYSFNYSVVTTPSTTPDEVHDIIVNTSKIRIYDRLYSVNQQEKKKEEAYQAGGTTKIDRYMTAQEERFYNSLPGRWQAIILSVDIQRPGTWSDSYSVRVIPQHGEGDRWIRLEAIDAAEMKELIEHYIETGEDYLPY